MKILVTGGCGFIGSNFLNMSFEKNFSDILNIDSLTYAANPDNYYSADPYASSDHDPIVVGLDLSGDNTSTPDITPPTIAINDDDANDSLSAGDTATLTFTLSEASTDFVESDVTVTGGSLSNWTVLSNTVYTATFTPYTDSTTDGNIQVANDQFSDAAGNFNQDESDADNTVAFTVDTVRPIIDLDSDVNDLKVGDTAVITFTLSEASDDFIKSDVSVSGGELSDWTSVSSTSYTATFTPAADSTTDGIVHVANDQFSDAAGNTNQDESDADNTVNLTINTTAPSPPVDSNSDGFVDNVSHYQLLRDGLAIDLTKRNGKTLSDESSRAWDAVTPIRGPARSPTTASACKSIAHSRLAR